MPTATKVACSTVVVTPGAEPMLLPVTELRTKAQHRSCTGKEGRTEATHAHLVGAMCGEPTTGANSRMQLGLAAANTRDQPERGLLPSTACMASDPPLPSSANHLTAVMGSGRAANRTCRASALERTPPADGEDDDPEPAPATTSATWLEGAWTLTVTSGPHADTV